MSSINETVVENVAITGSYTYRHGESVFAKYYDTGSGKWERLSGSGAPYVRPHPDLEDTTNKAVRVNVVAGGAGGGLSQIQVTTGSGQWVNVGYSGSDNAVPVNMVAGNISVTSTPGLSSGSLYVSGSVNVSGSVQVTGSTVTFSVSGSNISVDARQSGSWSINIGGAVVSGSVGITGSSTLPVNITSDIGKSVTGSIGISITGSTATIGTSLVGTSISGSVGITGSTTLPINITQDIGKSLTGSIGLSITGSSTLPVSLVGTAISGSVGITGSSTLTVNVSQIPAVNITGSQTLPVYDAGVLSNIASAPSGSSIVKMDLTYSGTQLQTIVYSGSSDRLFSLTFTYDGSGNLTKIVRGA